MSHSHNGNEQERKAEFPGQQPTVEQLRRLQRDIAEQSQQVTQTLNLIAEALDNGTTVSAETMSHAQAQILRLHLYLDDLTQLLGSSG
jgi:hypothetical protein